MFLAPINKLLIFFKYIFNMKVLVLGQNSDSFRLFSDIFHVERDFFDIYYANFLEKTDYYDAILAEDSLEEFSNIQKIPIIILRNSKNIVQNNVIYIEKCIPEIIRKTLKCAYTVSETEPSNHEIVLYQDFLQNTTNQKKIILTIENTPNILNKIYKFLTNYNIPSKIIRSIGLILCEILVSSYLPNITGTIEFCERGINLILPILNLNNIIFSIHAFCDNAVEIHGQIQLSWYYYN